MVPPVSTAGDAIGQSEVFLQFQERLSRVARVNRPVLLLGERGTGKELAAHRLHFLSGRWEGPFVALNCAALAPTLIESELFGHEKGAFTGAVERRRGRFELAHGGTLFLDELGCVPMEAQEKVLRAVEYGSFERVGGQRSVQVDARLIGASNRNLHQLAQAGGFKEDLLDRLSFEVLFLPPLRARKEDIPLLAAHFAARMAHELGRPGVSEFSDAAMQALVDYAWPGNIRELKNVVERAVYRADGPLIETIDVDPFRSPYLSTPETPAPPQTSPASLKAAVRSLEQTMLERALEESGDRQQEAARRLGLSYHQFRGLYRKYKA